MGLQARVEIVADIGGEVPDEVVFGVVGHGEPWVHARLVRESDHDLDRDGGLCPCGGSGLGHLCPTGDRIAVGHLPGHEAEFARIGCDGEPVGIEDRACLVQGEVFGAQDGDAADVVLRKCVGDVEPEGSAGGVFEDDAACALVDDLDLAAEGDGALALIGEDVDALAFRAAGLRVPGPDGADALHAFGDAARIAVLVEEAGGAQFLVRHALPRVGGIGEEGAHGAGDVEERAPGSPVFDGGDTPGHVRILDTQRASRGGLWGRGEGQRSEGGKEDGP